MNKLSENDKEKYCIQLGQHLKRLRAISGCTQEELAVLSGISKERISRIENGAFMMKWSQFKSLVFVLSMDTNTKEYLFASKIFTPQLLQFYQRKDIKIPPDITVPIADALMQEFMTDFKIYSSLSIDMDSHKTKRRGAKPV